MSFVIIKKARKNVPDDSFIYSAMATAGGVVSSITVDDGDKKVDYTGDAVNHTVFQNALENIADGNKHSWEFDWGDAAAADHSGPGLQATAYEVTIGMKPETVTALTDGGYHLYAFKAVQAAQGGGKPLVWFQLGPNEFSADTEVHWQVQYEAYTSTSKLIPNGKVRASFHTLIELGQTLNVVPGGTGAVVAGGPKQAISIHNTTQTPYTCGISQQSGDGKSNPMCGFPLYGLQLDVMAPIEKVLLMFSTTPVNTGTVIEQAYSPGVFVDLTSANSRRVNYDINKGWSWKDNAAWGRQVPANSNLVPLLIENAAAVSARSVQPWSLVSGG